MAHMTLPKSTYVNLAAVSLNFDHIHDLGAHAETQMSRRKSVDRKETPKAALTCCVDQQRQQLMFDSHRSE